MNTQRDFAEPTKAERAAAEISRTGKSVTVGELVPTSLRLPSWLMAKLDAMATHSGTSRNHVINLVIDAGLDAVLSHVQPTVLAEIEFLASDAMSTTRAQGKNESGEL